MYNDNCKTVPTTNGEFDAAPPPIETMKEVILNLHDAMEKQEPCLMTFAGCFLGKSRSKAMQIRRKLLVRTMRCATSEELQWMCWKRYMTSIRKSKGEEYGKA